MDARRLRELTERIIANGQALDWLNKCGPALTKDDVTVSVSTFVGGSVDGARDALRVIESYARLGITDLVATSITSCRNSIQMDVDAVRELLDSALVDKAP